MATGAVASPRPRPRSCAGPRRLARRPPVDLPCEPQRLPQCAGPREERMSLTDREFWTVIHGMVLGTLFLLSFAGGLAGLYSLRSEWVTAAGMQERVRRLDIGTVLMAIVAWLTVITGTYIIY